MTREPETLIEIVGGGVAAACCAHLLQEAGLGVRRAASGRSGVPALMLSDPARALLRDVMGDPALFERNARINRRIVAWGGQEPKAMPHGAVMLGAGDLDFAAEASARQGTPCFTIHTDGPPGAAAMTRFGERHGETVPVALLESEDADACWIEAVENGWLFMIPSAATQGWLLAIGAPLDQLLTESRYLARRVEPDGAPPARFDTTPRMLDTFAADDWLACGSRSMAFDPICGDGTALAVRQALLVSGIVAAAHAGEDRTALFGHYRAMMIAAMRRHLRLSAEFYASGGTGPWWRAQHEAIAQGFARCSALLECEPPPRFSLEGVEIVRRELAA